MEVLSKKLEFIKKPADSFINPLIKKTSSKIGKKPQITLKMKLY